MVFKKLVPSDVAGVHAGNGVVHQEFGVDLGNTCSRRDGPEGLPKIIAPLGEFASIFFCFGEMP